MTLAVKADRQLKKERQDHPNSPGHDGKWNSTSPSEKYKLDPLHLPISRNLAQIAVGICEQEVGVKV